MYVREPLRAPVTLEGITVTSDVWTGGEAPYALTPSFNPDLTEYEVTVPNNAAADGSESAGGVFPYTENDTLTDVNGGDGSSGILSGTGRHSGFAQVVATHVVNPGYITNSSAKGAIAARGDLYHTTTVGAPGIVNTVMVTNTPVTTTVRNRVLGGTVDVGPTRNSSKNKA
jgi:hypothetical protein